MRSFAFKQITLIKKEHFNEGDAGLCREAGEGRLVGPFPGSLNALGAIRKLPLV